MVQCDRRDRARQLCVTRIPGSAQSSTQPPQSQEHAPAEESAGERFGNNGVNPENLNRPDVKGMVSLVVACVIPVTKRIHRASREVRCNVKVGTSTESRTILGLVYGLVSAPGLPEPLS